MSERIEVATGGTIERDDRCVKCHGPMLYRVDKAGNVTHRFCRTVGCSAFLVEIPE